MTAARVRAARELHRLLARGPAEGATVERASATLDALDTLSPVDCSTLLRWDGAASRYATVLNRDYPPFVERWFEAKGHTTERFRRVVMEGRTPLRPRDMPWEPVIVEEFARPTGFRDGFNVALHSPDGRYVGSLIGNTTAVERVDDLAVDLFTMLAGSMVPLVDPAPRRRPLSADLGDGSAEGMVVSRGGRVQSLTPAAEPELLRSPGPVGPFVRRTFDDRRAPRSMTLLVGRRVMEIAVEAGEHRALVLHRAVPVPFGLSVRELEVLAGMAEGATNAVLAERFSLTPRTVATYVERLLAKTGCPNRTAATHVAASMNLRVDPGTPVER